MDAAHVYWGDFTNDTIKRATHAGGSVTTIADAADGISNVAATGLHGSNLYWADNGNDSVRRIPVAGGSATTLVNSGLSNPVDIEVGSDGSYVYVLDRNGTSSAIKRVATASPHTVTTLVSNTTATPMDDPIAIALDPDNDYVYWLDVDDTAVRRVAADGAAGSFLTLTAAAGSTLRDLAVSSDGSAVYWLAHGRVKRISADGSGAVEDVATSGASQTRMRVHPVSETISGSCITDLGAVVSDYASHDWSADVSATCPRAFLTFTLGAATDLRVTATSPAIDPLPMLRKGGIGGEVATRTTAANGVSTPYVYSAAPGDYAIELVRGSTSSASTGSFSAQLQTQPTLTGCDLSLGTLSTEQLQVFGAYDSDCGDTRRYFFYLEYQASISVSASGVGFTPRIELRPGSQSDAQTPLAQDTQNPADIYQQVTSGSYRINVEQITDGDTYNLTFQAFGLPPPTRTPIPTPTPRFQPNVDVRIEPDPRGSTYDASGSPYAFTVEGNPGSFPVMVSSDDAVLRFTDTSATSLDCGPGATFVLMDLENLEGFHLHVCGDDVPSVNLKMFRQSDRAILATYTVFIGTSSTQPRPPAVTGPSNYVTRPNDHIMLGDLINFVCASANMACQPDLVANGFCLLVSMGLFVVPTQVARGRPSGFAVGLGVALAIVGLLLSNLMAGLPLWWAGVAFCSVFLLAGVALLLKVRRV